MQIEALGHVVLKVRNLERSVQFYRDILGMKEVAILGTSDHNISQSIYIQYPDGIDIELYVDADPALWKNNPEAVAVVRPFRL